LEREGEEEEEEEKGDTDDGGTKVEEGELLDEELEKETEGVQLAPGKACCKEETLKEELDEDDDDVDGLGLYGDVD
jgi:hypothetical protein